MLVPTPQDLADAYAVTRRATVRTPLLESVALAEACGAARVFVKDRKSTRLNSSHIQKSRMPSSA